MNKFFKKALSLASAFLIGVSMISPSVSKAEGEEYPVNVHKIKMTEGSLATFETKDYDVKTGITDLASHFGEGAQEVSDAYFLILSKQSYDSLQVGNNTDAREVSKAALKEKFGVDISNGQGVEEAKANLAAQAPNSTLTDGQIIKTEANGANFKLNEGDWVVVEIPQFTESDQQNVTASKATVLAFSIPFRYTDGTSQTTEETLNLYPKNEFDSKPEVNKSLLSKDGQEEVSNDNYDVNQEQTWVITSDFGEVMKNYYEYKFSDTIDNQLDFVNDSVEVFIRDKNNKEEKVDLNENEYTITQPTGDSRELVVSLNRQNLTDQRIDELSAGKDAQLVIRYKTKINENAQMGEQINNHVTLTFNNNPNEDPKTSENPEDPSVETGGARFVKQDGDNNQTKLQGAKFVVKKTVDNNVLYLKADGTWKENVTNAAGDAELKQFVSAENGEFEVKGLAYGDYQLEEIEAPEGYVLNDNTKSIDFTVSNQSYTQALNEVNNFPPGEIPSTGGMGTVIFTVVGVLLMGSAFYFIKKRNAQYN